MLLQYGTTIYLGRVSRQNKFDLLGDDVIVDHFWIIDSNQLWQEATAGIRFVRQGMQISRQQFVFVLDQASSMMSFCGVGNSQKVSKRSTHPKKLRVGKRSDVGRQLLQNFGSLKSLGFASSASSGLAPSLVKGRKRFE